MHWLAGCEMALEMPMAVEPKLTIVSHPATGTWQEPRISVYSSKAVIDTGAYVVPSGTQVWIKELESGKSFQLNRFDDGGDIWFAYPQGLLRPTHHYEIKAVAPGFDTASAVTQIPGAASIANLTIQNVSVKPSEKNEDKEILRYEVNFEIRHLAPNRYYHLVFLNQYEGLEDLLLVTEPEPTDDFNYLPHYDFGILISKDDLSPVRPLSFDFLDWIVEGDELKEVYVELRTVTEEYYRYHTSLARQRMVRNDPFAEPVPVYNNVDGGFGSFSGFSSRIVSAAMPQ